VNRKAVFCALVSAALFGISTPAAKALVGSVHPAMLAGLLYCIVVLASGLPQYGALCLESLHEHPKCR
jgi:drug/metabolite transporter (DMT)-like permease